MEDLPLEPQFLEGAGSKVLKENVGFAREALNQGETVRVAQVQRDEFLVTGLKRPPERRFGSGIDVAAKYEADRPYPVFRP